MTATRLGTHRERQKAPWTWEAGRAAEWQWNLGFHPQPQDDLNSGLRTHVVEVETQF